MSNKHWCMPNYGFLKQCRRRFPELIGLGDKDAIARCFGVLGVEASKHPMRDAQIIMDAYKAGNLPSPNDISRMRKQEALIDEQDQMELLLLESWLLHRNSPSLFVESMELVHFLNESTYSEDVLQQAIDVDEFKWFCFPSRSIGGVNLRSCFFGRSAGRCVYRVYLWNENIMQSAVNTDGAAHAFREGRCTVADADEFSRVSDLHLKLCMAATVYALAFPDCVIEGLPSGVKSDSTANRILKPAKEIMCGATRTSVSMHIRAGHFKTLQHERFKRNEDGTPKVIFVRQTVVAGKLTPKTAVGL